MDLTSLRGGRLRLPRDMIGMWMHCHFPLEKRLVRDRQEQGKNLTVIVPPAACDGESLLCLLPPLRRKVVKGTESLLSRQERFQP